MRWHVQGMRRRGRDVGVALRRGQSLVGDGRVIVTMDEIGPLRDDGGCFLNWGSSICAAFKVSVKDLSVGDCVAVR